MYLLYACTCVCAFNIAEKTDERQKNCGLYEAIF